MQIITNFMLSVGKQSVKSMIKINTTYPKFKLSIQNAICIKNTTSVLNAIALVGILLI